MTPEQKFKDWALDPNGGGWKQDPNENRLSISSLGVCEMWRNEQAAFLAGMEADKWISVEERLPEFADVCLVSDENGYMEVTGFDGEFFPPEEWEVSDIKFWQPLPKPPKP